MKNAVSPITSHYCSQFICRSIGPPVIQRSHELPALEGVAVLIGDNDLTGAPKSKIVVKSCTVTSALSYLGKSL